MHRYIRRAVLALLAVLPLAAAGAGQAYPSKPVTLVLPFPAGGQTDTVARLLAHRLEPILGQPVLVDNRPGANSLIGTNHVARAPADGHTLLLNMTALVSNPILLPGSDYDPMALFQPVFRLYRIPAVWAVPADGPATLAEFVEKARNSPRPLTFATTGHASSSHYFGEMFAKAAGVAFTHVPYKGDALILPDLLAGRVDAAVVSSLTAMQYGKDGRIRNLAASGKQRWKVLPAVPTFEELGVRGTATETFAGIFVPAATPPDIVARLHAAIGEAVASEDFKRQLMESGLEAAPPLDPAGFREVMLSAQRDWIAAKAEFDIRAE